MGLGQLPAITARLIGGGLAPDTPAAVIEKGTLPDQKVVRAPLSGIHAKVMEEGIAPRPSLLWAKPPPFI